jgi:hypothetical protein
MAGIMCVSGDLRQPSLAAEAWRLAPQVGDIAKLLRKKKLGLLCTIFELARRFQLL